MKYILTLLLLFSTSSFAAKGYKCVEPKWLGICGEVQENVVGQLEIEITIDKKIDGWIRFTMVCTNKELDPVYGYAKKIKNKWKLITFGTAISPEDCDKLNIPIVIR